MRRELLTCSCGVNWQAKNTWSRKRTGFNKLKTARAAVGRNEINNDAHLVENRHRTSVAGAPFDRAPLLDGLGPTAGAHGHSLQCREPGEWLDVAGRRILLYRGALLMPGRIVHGNHHRSPQGACSRRRGMGGPWLVLRDFGSDLLQQRICA